MAQWGIENYSDARGRVPVNETLKGLPPNDYARVLRAIDLLADYGPALRMPHAQHLGGKIWELRIDGRPNSYRVLYAGVQGRKFLLLHIFAKKSQKTPPREVDTARRRLADYLERTTP
jgi:phage-related protein